MTPATWCTHADMSERETADIQGEREQGDSMPATPLQLSLPNQLTTTRVRLGTSILVPSMPGPASLGVAQTACSPRGSGYMQSCYMCKLLGYI